MYVFRESTQKVEVKICFIHRVMILLDPTRPKMKSPIRKSSELRK